MEILVILEMFQIQEYWQRKPNGIITYNKNDIQSSKNISSFSFLFILVFLFYIFYFFCYYLFYFYCFSYLTDFLSIIGRSSYENNSSKF